MNDDKQLRELTCDPKHRRVLITDGRTEVGFALAQALGEAGAATVFVGLAENWREFAGLGALKSIANVKIMPLDLTDTVSVQECAGEIGGKVDILINNARHIRPGGVMGRHDVVTAGDEMDVNYFGLMRLMRGFGPAMRGRGADGVNSAFVGPVCVIDCSAQSAADEDYLLDVAMIKKWEARHGDIAANSWVLMRSDWSKKSAAAYPNLRADGAHSPGPSPTAMRYLVKDRDILGFGTETVGTDAGQGAHLAPPYPAHYILHGAGKFGLLYLANLDQLPPTGAILICPPLKIKHGSGSPLRVLALVES